MLKKFGIVAAVATAGVIAITPFAFAGDDHHGSSSDVNYSNVEENNVSNDCEFGQAGPQVSSSATGGSSLLGVAGLVTSLVAPVTTQTQLLNCNNINVSDVVDFDSNNSERTSTRTEIEDSGNTVVED